MLKRYAIIAAGGRGTRLHAEMDGLRSKQFVEIAGRPLLAHTLLQVVAAVPRWDALIVVVPPASVGGFDWASYCLEVAGSAFHLPRHSCVLGGEKRFDSVHAGLQALPDWSGEEEALVVVHDGVRPLVGASVFERVLACAQQWGAAVAALPMTASLRKQVDDQRSMACDRSRFVEVQTPQAFRLSWLRAAFGQASGAKTFTDEASVVEAAGYAIRLVEGDRMARKITYAEDLEWLRTRTKAGTTSSHRPPVSVSTPYAVKHNKP